MKTETEKDDSGRSSQASGSAAAHRMQIAQMERAGVALTLYPGGQAEAIARHYVAMANTARDLLALLEARDGYGRRLSETDAVVAFLVGEIKERHANDFGIPLEWPNAEVRDGGGAA